MLRIFRDDGWEYRRADFGTTDGDKRFAFTGRRLSGYILSPSSRACPGTLACPGTYSKRPRSKNNHRWMFPRSRISVIPGSTRDLRDDGWEYRRADIGTTGGNIAGPISGRRMEVCHRDAETTHSPSSRACPGTYSKRPLSIINPRWIFLRIPNIAGAISGRRMGISLGRFRDDEWTWPKP